jgi:hypothetical protein
MDGNNNTPVQRIMIGDPDRSVQRNFSLQATAPDGYRVTGMWRVGQHWNSGIPGNYYVGTAYADQNSLALDVTTISVGLHPEARIEGMFRYDTNGNGVYDPLEDQLI